MFRKISNGDDVELFTTTSSLPNIQQMQPNAKQHEDNGNRGGKLKILGFINSRYQLKMEPIPLLEYLKTPPSIDVVHRYMLSLTLLLIELEKRDFQLCNLSLDNVYILRDSPRQAFLMQKDHQSIGQPLQQSHHQLKLLLFSVGYNYCPFGEADSLLDILRALQHLLPEYQLGEHQKQMSPSQLMTNLFGLQLEEENILYDLGTTSVYLVRLPEIINTTDEYVVKLIVQDDEKYANREIQILEHLNEDKRLASLICYTRIYAHGQCRQAFVMKYYQLTLSQVLAKQDKKVLEVPLLKHISIGILQAMQCLHEQGIIHRDLKPQNIMLDSMNPMDATVVIIDFDRSTYYGAHDSSQSLEQSVNFTTRQYEPPEMKSTLVFQPSYDVWQFGIILSELACYGRIKLRLGSQNRNQNSEMEMETLKHNLLKAQCNKVIVDVIWKCLQTNPNVRISTAQALELLNRI